ncbi:sodium-dependent phosphate transport protein 2B-like [Mya arenaria]|uniref:sodium-dependent phosphate transport protein 2B-like n=1 Tax=Mya arenaria TaxID=6604 RepID=UPI0022E3DBA5|nr:sodium-dependent phosphate transport protein 2B-like [Mya arenaria]
MSLSFKPASTLARENETRSSVDSLPPPYEEAPKKGETNLGYIEHSGEDVIVTVDDPGYQRGLKPEPEAEEEDPWKISKVYVKVVPWGELTTCGKVKRVTWDYFGKLVVLTGLLYLFICSLDFLSNAFKLIGGRAAGEIFKQSELLSNPVTGLMIGILATVLFQSSSTTTSIVVSMVAAKIIPVRNAIPMVMGANIGTSVTNTIVSIGQITNKGDFRRAFAGATVHDMFNWLTVLVLLPLEAATSYLFHLSDAIVRSMHLSTNEGADREFLKKLTHPFTKLVVQVDKKVIEDIAHGRETANATMIKHCCRSGTRSVTLWNSSADYNTTASWYFNYTAEEKVCEEKCNFLFESASNTLSETTIGIILLVIALVILCACLIGIVKTLNSLLQGKVALIIKKFVNADFPGVMGYFTGYLAILIGTGLTILVQSSSVFTSALTPLVGIGVIEIERMYPLTLGANIGTTTTAILAALAQSADDIENALQISFCHLFFNLSGILMFFPIPKSRFPIAMAKFLGNQTAKYRWFAVVYLILVFFILPAAVFGLSVVSWIAMAAVFGPLLLLFIIIGVIKVIQNKAPGCLPVVLRDWKFLPKWLRSLEPADRVIQKVVRFLPCCRACCKQEANKNSSEVIKSPMDSTNL